MLKKIKLVTEWGLAVVIGLGFVIWLVHGVIQYLSLVAN